MKINKILIVLGEPQSTFSEILLKYFSSKEFSKNNKKIILIGSKILFQKQMKKLKFNFKLKKINNLKEAAIKELNILLKILGTLKLLLILQLLRVGCWVKCIERGTLDIKIINLFMIQLTARKK